MFILIPILNDTFLLIALAASSYDPRGAIVLIHNFSCYFTVYQAFDIIPVSTARNKTNLHPPSFILSVVSLKQILHVVTVPLYLILVKSLCIFGSAKEFFMILVPQSVQPIIVKIQRA